MAAVHTLLPTARNLLHDGLMTRGFRLHAGTTFGAGKLLTTVDRVLMDFSLSMNLIGERPRARPDTAAGARLVERNASETVTDECAAHDGGNDDERYGADHRQA